MSSDESPIYIPPTFICVICQEVLWKESDGKIIASAPCGHVYHQVCIRQWLASQSNEQRCQGECPTCYKSTNFSQCHKIFLSVDDDDSLLTQLRVGEEVRKDNMNLRKELENVLAENMLLKRERTDLKKIFDDAKTKQAKRVSPTTIGTLTPAATPTLLPTKGRTMQTARATTTIAGTSRKGVSSAKTTSAGTSRNGVSSSKTTTPALNRKAAPKRLTAMSNSSTSSSSMATVFSPRVVAGTGMKLRPRVKVPPNSDKTSQGTRGKITAIIANPVKGRKDAPTPAPGRVAPTKTGRS